MTQRTIQSPSLGFDCLKAYLRAVFHLFFRRVHVSGRERIAGQRPIIFAVNHQNTVLDAFAVHFTQPHRTVFMARADIFERPIVARMLAFLKILPIYRIRDGFGILRKKRGSLFDTAVDVLRDGACLGIMPEGSHLGRKRLRPLLKGVFRIALRAQADYGDRPGVRIIPVGIDYSDYFKCHQVVQVRYGQPIEVCDYWQTYQEKPAQAVNRLQTDLARAMRGQMLDIQNATYYDCILFLAGLYNTTYRQKAGLGDCDESQFRASQAIAADLERAASQQPELMARLDRLVAEFRAALATLGFRHWQLQPPCPSLIRLISRSLLALTLLPLFLPAVLVNVIPGLLVRAALGRFRDRQFHLSVKFAAGAIVFPAFYGLLAVAAGWLAGSVLIALACFALVSLSWFFAIRYYVAAKKLVSSWRFRSQKAAVKRLRAMYERVVQLTANMVAT